MTAAPVVTIVIPCYNQGRYVADALDSVAKQTFGGWEVVIVNDGSTDGETERLLREAEGGAVRVLHTENRGLASARNAGIGCGRGKYILPLDADDRIGPTYLAEALPLLEADDSVGIVYCDAEFFGGLTGPWRLPPFSIGMMLLCNVIFCSALFRRADWTSVGGYNPNMTYGYEDWDLWLSILERGRRVKKLPSTNFYYRVRHGSMLRRMSLRKNVAMHLQVLRNHPSFYLRHSLEMVPAFAQYLHYLRGKDVAR